MVLSPTSPTAAFELGAKTSDPIAMYLNDIYSIAANLAGLPGISIPVRLRQRRRQGPAGRACSSSARISASRGCSSVSHQYQQHTDWHKRVPAGYA